MSQTTAATTTLITAGRIITDPEQPPLEHGAVLLRSGTIAAVGPLDELASISDEADRLDFPTGTIIPGLINAHIHLAFDVTTDPRPALETAWRGVEPAAGLALDTVRATIAANARSVIDGGVTTARDLGDLGGLVAAFRDQVETGRACGPHILSAFSPLTAPRGHCWFLGGELDTRSASGHREAERAIRAAVSERADAGADVIKVMASGGNLTPSGAPMWQSQFSAQDLTAIVAAAHERGLPVAGHAHGTAAMALCARAGVDTIEHGSWRSQPGPDGTIGYDTPDEVADLVAASGAVMVPTRSRGWASWPAEARLELQLSQLAWAHGRGIPMIAGNDAGVGQGYFDDLVDAITLFEAAGWSRARALAAATTRAAQALGQSHRIGSLTPGRRADLVVLDADPLNDLSVLKQVHRVVIGGRIHDPTIADRRG